MGVLDKNARPVQSSLLCNGGKGHRPPKSWSAAYCCYVQVRAQLYRQLSGKKHDPNQNHCSITTCCRSTASTTRMHPTFLGCCALALPWSVSDYLHLILLGARQALLHRRRCHRHVLWGEATSVSPLRVTGALLHSRRTLSSLGGFSSMYGETYITSANDAIEKNESHLHWLVRASLLGHGGCP